MNVLGMHQETGLALEGVDHLRQSIFDILNTPLGSRVYRRFYGSKLFELLDRPANAAWRIEVVASVFSALSRFERRIKLTRVRVDQAAEGVIVLTLEAQLLINGKSITLDGIRIGNHVSKPAYRPIEVAAAGSD